MNAWEIAAAVKLVIICFGMVPVARTSSSNGTNSMHAHTDAFQLPDWLVGKVQCLAALGHPGALLET